jgi:hypothetical protein
MRHDLHAMVASGWRARQYEESLQED